MVGERRRRRRGTCVATESERARFSRCLTGSRESERAALATTSVRRSRNFSLPNLVSFLLRGGKEEEEDSEEEGGGEIPDLYLIFFTVKKYIATFKPLWK